MSSPWEGGSRPVEYSATAELATTLIGRGNHVEARLVATGIFDLMNAYVNAETALGTHPADILKAFSATAASIFAGIIAAAGESENYDTLASSCGSMVIEMTKATLASYAEGR